MGTKQNPGSFDCYTNAFNDEPMFVLLARDENAPNRVRDWAETYRAVKERANDAKRMTVEQYAKYSEALDCADAMDVWRKNYRNENRVKDQKKTKAVMPALAHEPKLIG